MATMQANTKKKSAGFYLDIVLFVLALCSLICYAADNAVLHRGDAMIVVLSVAALVLMLALIVLSLVVGYRQYYTYLMCAFVACIAVCIGLYVGIRIQHVIDVSVGLVSISQMFIVSFILYVVTLIVGIAAGFCRTVKN